MTAIESGPDAIKAAGMTRLADEAQRFRASGALGRSDVVERLFDFLLQRSLAERIPKEFEVAEEVFGKSTDFDMTQDASVRVYIHRLRRKLDEYYAARPAGAGRLAIPRGEYRLEWQPDTPVRAVDPDDAPSDEGAVGLRNPWFTPRRGWAVLATIVAVNVVGWVGFTLSYPTDGKRAAATSAFWDIIASSNARTLVVTGDYYIFGEAPDTMEVKRLVREYSVNSSEDLDKYVMTHPDSDGRYVNLDLHYLPTSTGTALRNILPIVDTTGTGLRPRVLPMSELSPEMLKTANVVYIGFLSGLGLLRNPVFQASGFQIGDSYDELIDRATGRHYLSDWGGITDGKTPHRDFGYLASFPGPTGNRIIIVAGTRDAAVMQTSEMAADPALLARIAELSGHADAFEALVEVRTIGNLNVGSLLVLARPLHVAALWKPDRRGEPAFPDQIGGGR